MNFLYDCEKLLGCDAYGIAIIEPSQKDFLKVHNYIAVCEVIDAIGGLSSAQRGLKFPITTAEKFFNLDLNKTDKIFIKAKGNCIIGFLRVGLRYLYLSDFQNKSIEENCNCVLDFYVHHSMQKLGHGKQIFDKMLRFLAVYPYELSYDNPGQKMIRFLYKHYSMINMVKQSNNFVVFREFFEGRNTNVKRVDYNYVLRHNNYKPDDYNKKSLQDFGAQVIKNGSIANNFMLGNAEVQATQKFYTPNHIPAKTDFIKDIKSANSNFDYRGNNNSNNYYTPYSNNLNVLNTNINKRFHNYFLNDQMNNNPNNPDERTSSTNSNKSQKEFDLIELKKKFDNERYLKNLIQERSSEYETKLQIIKELEDKVYRNPSPSFYNYQRKYEYSTVSDSKKI